MQTGFWITRYVMAAGVLLIILLAVEYFKGTLDRATVLANLAWSLAAAAIFIGSRYLRARQAITNAAARKK